MCTRTTCYNAICYIDTQVVVASVGCLLRHSDIVNAALPTASAIVYRSVSRYGYYVHGCIVPALMMLDFRVADNWCRHTTDQARLKSSLGLGLDTERQTEQDIQLHIIYIYIYIYIYI